MSDSKRNPLFMVLALSAVFFVLFLCLSGFLYYRSGGGGNHASRAAIFSSGAVGIVELNGVIMDSKKTLRRLRDFEERDDIKAVVLRLNSPGGAVAPSQEIYQAVKNYKKPIVASMSSVAASGAFYVAMGAKEVFANPGTITGSIGVIMEFANLEKLYDWAKIRRYVIKTGKFKDVGAEYREMQPEERALLQNMVDDVLVQFKKAVSDGRKMPLDQVTRIADGRVFSGAQAKGLRLVDELGSLQDTVNEAGKLGGIHGKPEVVYAQDGARKWLDLLMDDGRDEDSSESSSSTGLVTRLASVFLGRSSGGLQQAVTGLQPGVYWLWTGAQ
ncbi:MAG: signal peptide peptidase SppA [Oligoflexia bacterium]|nr:signal peptide peptidase SppA [Oligoflexia bacterium]